MEACATADIVGRDRELTALEQVLAAARTGAGAVVLVAGDAGIGKTRVALELAERARLAGFDVLVGRSIDLVGTELPYQPFVDALRPLGEVRRAAELPAASQLRVFEQTLELLTLRAAAAPVLLVLEDLHWADASSLDLVVFLAHNLGAERVLLLATCRPDEPGSAERMRRLAEGVRRAGAGSLLRLDPIEDGAVAALLAARAGAAADAALVAAIVARAEGNPFFAEELLAARDDRPQLPRGLRDLLLQRVGRLESEHQSVLRVAAAAGRDVSYPLLCSVSVLQERDVRESLRRAVEAGVLVADQAAGAYRFRHALLAEAVYSTILPGEREELHGRLAETLVLRGGAAASELAPHWAAANRPVEAFAASVEAARESEAVFGLAEAHAHLERALGLWETVPDAAELAGLDLVGVCAWAAQLASESGAAPRAVELERRAISLVGAKDPHRASFLHVRLGEYLYETSSDEAALAALARAVELAPPEPPSPERAYALASLAGGLMVAWRHRESLAVAEEALALARRVGAREAEVRALTVVGMDLTYLGRTEEGLETVRSALRLAEEVGDRIGLERCYVNLSDALMMVGRLRESARVAQEGLDAMGPYGVTTALLVSNAVEALVAGGDLDEADRLSAAAIRTPTSSFSDSLLMVRALVETERGEFDAARSHLDGARETLRADRGFGLFDALVADLALWERRFADAEAAVEQGLAHSRRRAAAHVRVQLCVRGLRAQTELATLARALRDGDALRDRLARVDKLLATARAAAAEAASITPTAAAWLAVAEAEHGRACGEARSDLWSAAAEAWAALGRPGVEAYCRFRQAESLVARGASRTEAAVPLRDAHGLALGLGAKPLLRELELLAERARLDLAPPPEVQRPDDGFEKALGLTAREAEVLALLARGYTNREIAATLVISVKTAGVHVSHILRKLGAPNRREAAAIAHRISPPG